MKTSCAPRYQAAPMLRALLATVAVGLMACSPPAPRPDVSVAPDADAAAQDAQVVQDAYALDDSTSAPSTLPLAARVDTAQIRASIEALERLGTRYTHSPGSVTARDLIASRLRSYGLPVELDSFPVEGTTSANVIARLAGVETPEIVYIFSAHYDSTSEDPMNAAPGADDNASGVAAVLEAARILAPLRFRASLWFVLTGAEEQGSVGSFHLATRLVSEGVNVRGVIAPDMLAYWPLGDLDAMDILGDAASRTLVDSMATIATALGVEHKIWIRHDYCAGDDHTNFQEHGFPAISPMDCVEAHNVRSSGETLPHYHRSSDRVGTLYLPFTVRVVGVIVATFAEWGGLLAGG